MGVGFCRPQADAETERLIPERHPDAKPHNIAEPSTNSVAAVGADVLPVVMVDDEDDDERALADAVEEAHRHREQNSLMTRNRELARVAEAKRVEAEALAAQRRTARVERIQAMVRRKQAQNKAKLLRKRRLVADEILASERKYVEMLVKCVKMFFPLRERLDKEVIEELGMNKLYQLMEFNQSFLEELERDWRIGRVFLSFDFGVYTSYINQSGDAMALVYNLKHKKSFQQFWIQLKEEHPDVLELPAYLIQPIQRLPRYCLLLENLLELTAQDHDDYSDLKLAVEKTRRTADYLNEQKRIAEKIARFGSIKNRISKLPVDFKPSGYLNQEGEFLLVDETPGQKKKQKKMTLFLFDGGVLIGKHDKSALKRLLQRPASFVNRSTNRVPQLGPGNAAHAHRYWAFVCWIPLNEISVVPNDDDTMSLHHQQLSYTLGSKKEGMIKEWVQWLSAN